MVNQVQFLMTAVPGHETSPEAPQKAVLFGGVAEPSRWEAWLVGWASEGQALCFLCAAEKPTPRATHKDNVLVYADCAVGDL